MNKIRSRQVDGFKRSFVRHTSLFIKISEKYFVIFSLFFTTLSIPVDSVLIQSAEGFESDGIT